MNKYLLFIAFMFILVAFNAGIYMSQKTVSGYHSGVSYFIKIEDHGGKYKAHSIMLFKTHQHLHDWCKDGEIDLTDGRTCKGNHFYYQNPEPLLVPATKGMIDSVTKLIAVSDRIQSGDFTGINSTNYPERLKEIQRLGEIIQEAKTMKRMRPETQPTPEEEKTMKAEVDRLISMFSIVGLSSLTGRSSQVIVSWRARGRISATAAHEICQLPEIKALGFTREGMRPDVKYWYIDNMTETGA